MTDGAVKRRVAVLISGRGSNMIALADACTDPAYPAQIVGVLSDRAEANGLQAARARSIPTIALPRARFADRLAHEAAMHERLVAWRAEFVCLAGFMRLLSAAFLAPWAGRIVNIHPSLLPAFPGLDTHRRAIEAGVRFAGCTVHFVRAEVDRGPIIVQAAVAVRPGDDAASLAARVLEAEHVCYPRALRLIAEGRTRVCGEAVKIDGAAAPDGVSINPHD